MGENWLVWGVYPPTALHTDDSDDEGYFWKHYDYRVNDDNVNTDVDANDDGDTGENNDLDDTDDSDEISDGYDSDDDNGNDD